MSLETSATQRAFVRIGDRENPFHGPGLYEEWKGVFRIVLGILLRISIYLMAQVSKLAAASCHGWPGAFVANALRAIAVICATLVPCKLIVILEMATQSLWTKRYPRDSASLSGHPRSRGMMMMIACGSLDGFGSCRNRCI